VDEATAIAAITERVPLGAMTLLGAGDDAAVVRCPDGRTVVTTDQMVEGVHFRLGWATPFDLGAKMAARCLADVAAMGATPTAMVVALAGPRELIGGEWAQRFAEGLGRYCARCGAGVVGGDLVAAPAVAVCATGLGDLEGRSPVTRAGARPGERLALACAAPPGLGASAAGLAYLEAGRPDLPEALRPLALEAAAAYHVPDPPLPAGPEAAEAGASAMIDLSDGLLRDAGRVARASGVRLVLEGRRQGLALPARGLGPLARALGQSAWDWVLGGGEDHALLAAFPGAGRLPKGWRVVGRVEAAGGSGPGVDVEGVSARHRPAGWDHFG
jgi:thiamine-monophosphate kinase